MPLNNQAYWGTGEPSVRVGRRPFLEDDGSARADTAKALSTRRHYVRVGRKAYVEDVTGHRRS